MVGDANTLARGLDLSDEPRWSVAVVCEALQLDKRRLYELLPEAGVTRVVYGRIGRHPRRRRLFSDRDVKAIAKARRKYRKLLGTR